ncbi:hypothetical protein MKX01_006304 [Papaver californicum]|nr:hypothetical protein MKX01_006304 [Papaver californicum]
MIDAVPPISPFKLETDCSVYANSSIYWLYSGFNISNDEPLIVEFDVGIEKFRVISIPNFIINDIRAPYNHSNALLEVDVPLVLLAKNISPGDTWTLDHGTSMKMSVFRNKNASSGSSTIKNYFWTEDSFLVPPLAWEPSHGDCVVPIPGTDLFIIRSVDGFSFYYYNWKQKSFSNKFQFNGFHSFINKNAKKEPLFFRCFSFAENIFPVK